MLVNPLHAATPVFPQDPSPYFPSSRRFRNVLYLRVEDVPGASTVDIEAAARAGQALNEQRLIDRDQVLRLKLDALQRVWARFSGDSDFDGTSPTKDAALEGGPRSACSPNATAPTGGRGPRSCDARTSPTWRAPRGRAPTACGSTSGCSGCSTDSLRPRRRTSPSCTISPSGSIPAAPTPGRGRTCWHRASRSARRPTSSTPRARSGACRRSTRGNCALRLPAVRGDGAGERAPRRRPAHRPRPRPGAPVLGARRGGDRPTASTSGTRSRTCSTSSPARAQRRRRVRRRRGPRHVDAGDPRRASRPPVALLPAGVVRA